MLIDMDRDSSFPFLHLPALQTEPGLFREPGGFWFALGLPDPNWCEGNPLLATGLHTCGWLAFSLAGMSSLNAKETFC